MNNSDHLLNAFHEIAKRSTGSGPSYMLLNEAMIIHLLTRQFGLTKDEAQMYWDLIILSGDEQELF